jgi:hypothetical protein
MSNHLMLHYKNRIKLSNIRSNLALRFDTNSIAQNGEFDLINSIELYQIELIRRFDRSSRARCQAGGTQT